MTRESVPESENGKLKRSYVDTRTRFAGVYARHSLYCGLGIGHPRCTCHPSYWGKAWDAEAGRHRKTRRRRQLSEARNLREDLQVRIRQGAFIEPPNRIGFEDARSDFLADCHNGVALKKQGRPTRGSRP